jgi:hypothetical protein
MNQRAIMTLGKMRASGIHTVERVCPQCGCHGIIHVDGLPGDVAVAELGEGVCCVNCGAARTRTQPNWREGEQRSATRPRRRSAR